MNENNRVIIAWSKTAFYLQTLIPLFSFLMTIIYLFMHPVNVYGFIFLSFWFAFLFFLVYPVISCNPPLIIEDEGILLYRYFLRWKDIKVFRLRKVKVRYGYSSRAGFILSEEGYQKLNRNKTLWYIIPWIKRSVFSFLGFKNENRDYILFPGGLEISHNKLLELLKSRHEKIN